MQAATDGESADGLVYFAFDLLHLDGEDLLLKPLLERKTQLTEIMRRAPGSLQYSDHVGQGPAFLRQACKLGAEGIMSKLADAPYRPGDRGGAWLKTKCLNREEFIVVGWTDPGVAGRISARSCSPITRLMAVWCTPAARALACLCESWQGSRLA
jgi:bifunctional non-homologous end joining protein LigD